MVVATIAMGFLQAGNHHLQVLEMDLLHLLRIITTITPLTILMDEDKGRPAINLAMLDSLVVAITRLVTMDEEEAVVDTRHIPTAS